MNKYTFSASTQDESQEEEYEENKQTFARTLHAFEMAVDFVDVAVKVLHCG